ncbi:MAG: VTT domain-containing protein [Proteobacteria bacterium]|nr:VTT domain-containing protein [Pseudomonadota bacterium]MBU4469647.1 VTT domain-containing protein [Pseudomonadota bacterium]MCG2751730.1 VTT domain-containing protein [Desulfobacteraceae bacterium]
MENETNPSRRGAFYVKIALMLILAGLLAGTAYAHWDRLVYYFHRYYDVLTDSERIKAFIQSFGMAAPLVFILVQILQVVLAPVPGEATGFIGGYLFGALPGFFYSTIGLTTGSIINLLIGRYLGNHLVRRIISPRRMVKFDRILKRQGVVVFFIFFIIPGFPKDYLCFFLGLSKVPLRILILMAGVGRIPGTLMLSLQGATLFDKNFGLTLILLLLCLLIGGVSFKYKDRIYSWVEKYNGK